MGKQINQKKPDKRLEQKQQKKLQEKIDLFPMPICLHESGFDKIDKNILSINATEILKTLYCFSDKDRHAQKHPHPIHKDKKLEKYFNRYNKVMSLDIKSSGNKNSTRGNLRLFYAIDNNGICKILNLCSDETH